MMTPDGPGSGLERKRRRRSAVVCTDCRRRKIACDRNHPCSQCLHSHLECTYHHSYATRPLGPNDALDGASSPPGTSTPSSRPSSIQHSHEPESAFHVNYSGTFAPASTFASSTAAVDVGAPSWLDTDVFDAFNQPLTNPINDGSVSLLTPDSMTALSHGRPDAAASAMPSPPKQASLFATEPIDSLRASSRLYRPAHWMTILRKYQQHGLFDEVISVLFPGEDHPLLQKCKTVAREVKSRRADAPSFLASLRDYMPPRKICDELVQLYLRTFESVLRVLHVPSLQREYDHYWSNPLAASESVILQILLVMAIGTCFYQDPPGAGHRKALRGQATQWIQAAQQQLAAPFRKKHLNVRGVQLQCLLVIAFLTNTNAVGGDLVWISVASLVQSAKAVGLHLAPSQSPITALEAEVRRRLWVTVLELAVQCSLDSGVHPAVSTECLNCEAPSNLDDAEIGDSTEPLPRGHPNTTFTESSIQRALLRSLPIRFRIAEALSRSRQEITYDAALRMGGELTAACRETSKLIESFLLPRSTVISTRPSAFQIKTQDLLARRFLLLLHAQFAPRAASDVVYHFSRTVCHETALLLLSPGSGPDNEATRHREGRHSYNGSIGADSHYSPPPWPLSQDYASLQLFGDGLFKHVFLAAALIVSAEVLQQQREDAAAVAATAATSLSRRELLQAIEHAAHLTLSRVQVGETSVRAAAFFACMRVYASADHTLQRREVLSDTAQRVLNECYAILKSRSGRSEESDPMYDSIGRPRLSPISMITYGAPLSGTRHVSSWDGHAGFSCHGAR